MLAIAATANLQDEQLARLAESVAKKSLLIQRLQSEVAERTGAVEVEQRASLERLSRQEGELRQQLAEAQRELAGFREAGEADAAPKRESVGKEVAPVEGEEEVVDAVPLGLSESELVHHLMDGEHHAAG